MNLHKILIGNYSVAENILSYLSLRNVNNLSRTRSDIYEVCQRDNSWKIRVQHDFPESFDSKESKEPWKNYYIHLYFHTMKIFMDDDFICYDVDTERRVKHKEARHELRKGGRNRTKKENRKIRSKMIKKFTNEPHTISCRVLTSFTGKTILPHITIFTDHNDSPIGYWSEKTSLFSGSESKNIRSAYFYTRYDTQLYRSLRYHQSFQQRYEYFINNPFESACDLIRIERPIKEIFSQMISKSLIGNN